MQRSRILYPAARVYRPRRSALRSDRLQAGARCGDRRAARVGTDRVQQPSTRALDAGRRESAAAGTLACRARAIQPARHVGAGLAALAGRGDRTAELCGQGKFCRSGRGGGGAVPGSQRAVRQLRNDGSTRVAEGLEPRDDHRAAACLRRTPRARHFPGWHQLERQARNRHHSRRVALRRRVSGHASAPTGRRTEGRDVDLSVH